MKINDKEYSSPLVATLSAVAILVFIGCVAFMTSCTIIEPGQRGVMVKLGEVQDEVLGEGFHLVTPFITAVERYDVRVKRLDLDDAQSATNDLQQVTISLTVNYRLKSEVVASIHRDVGKEYENIIIIRAMTEAVKAATPFYKAEELIQKREEVSDLMRDTFRQKLDDYMPAFDIVEFNITDINFSPVFLQAVEDKQIAEQEAARVQNEVAKSKAEAEKTVAEARGVAEAMSQKAKVLRDNPKLLVLEFLSRWDGRLPLVLTAGDGGMIIDVQKLLEKQVPSETKE